jgi:hypothetical protein
MCTCPRPVRHGSIKSSASSRSSPIRRSGAASIAASSPSGRTSLRSSTDTTPMPSRSDGPNPPMTSLLPSSASAGCRPAQQCRLRRSGRAASDDLLRRSALSAAPAAGGRRTRSSQLGVRSATSGVLSASTELSASARNDQDEILAVCILRRRCLTSSHAPLVTGHLRRCAAVRQS